MTPFWSKDLSVENKLIGNILREYPQMSELMERHFGEDCLERPGFKIPRLGMACILFGVERKQLLQQFEKIQHC
jgi:hypothetical protein